MSKIQIISLNVHNTKMYIGEMDSTWTKYIRIIKRKGWKNPFIIFLLNFPCSFRPCVCPYLAHGQKEQDKPCKNLIKRFYPTCLSWFLCHLSCWINFCKLDLCIVHSYLDNLHIWQMGGNNRTNPITIDSRVYQICSVISNIFSPVESNSAI